MMVDSLGEEQLLKQSLPEIDHNIKLTIIKAEKEDEEQPANHCNTKQFDELAAKKPSFRLLPSCANKRRKFTLKRKDGYYHHNFITAAENMPEVEYDLDDEDLTWLKNFNQQLSNPNFKVSENLFERILDRMEKEAKFDIISPPNTKPLNVEDAQCSICGGKDAVTFNTILLCDMCDIPVHQECYGVPYLPEDTWLCRRCLHSPSVNVRCELCPNLGGAFKQTPDHKWVHVICALWIPEVTFANAVFMEPVIGLEQMHVKRWNSTCYICRKKGVCIQCNDVRCGATFHVTCGQQAELGMRMEMGNRYGGQGEEVSTYIDKAKIAYCDQHLPDRESNCCNNISNDNHDKPMHDEGCSVSDQQVVKKQRHSKKIKSLTAARKILKERRLNAPNPIAHPKIDHENLVQISLMLPTPYDSKQAKTSESLRNEVMKEILKYWNFKRMSRAGVPLIRRLQVSFNNSLARYASTAWSLEEKENYLSFRYQLEKARILIGEVYKRERLKLKVKKLEWNIAKLSFKKEDLETPVTDD